MIRAVIPRCRRKSLEQRCLTNWLSLAEHLADYNLGEQLPQLGNGGRDTLRTAAAACAQADADTMHWRSVALAAALGDSELVLRSLMHEPGLQLRRLTEEDTLAIGLLALVQNGAAVNVNPLPPPPPLLSPLPPNPSQPLPTHPSPSQPLPAPPPCKP